MAKTEVVDGLDMTLVPAIDLIRCLNDLRILMTPDDGKLGVREKLTAQTMMKLTLQRIAQLEEYTNKLEVLVDNIELDKA